MHSVLEKGAGPKLKKREKSKKQEKRKKRKKHPRSTYTCSTVEEKETRGIEFWSAVNIVGGAHCRAASQA